MRQSDKKRPSKYNAFNNCQRGGSIAEVIKEKHNSSSLNKRNTDYHSERNQHLNRSKPRHSMLSFYHIEDKNKNEMQLSNFDMPFRSTQMRFSELSSDKKKHKNFKIMDSLRNRNKMVVSSKLSPTRLSDDYISHNKSPFLPHQKFGSMGNIQIQNPKGKYINSQSLLFPQIRRKLVNTKLDLNIKMPNVKMANTNSNSQSKPDSSTFFGKDDTKLQLQLPSNQDHDFLDLQSLNQNSRNERAIKGYGTHQSKQNLILPEKQAAINSMKNKSRRIVATKQINFSLNISSVKNFNKGNLIKNRLNDESILQIKKNSSASKRQIVALSEQQLLINNRIQTEECDMDQLVVDEAHYLLDSAIDQNAKNEQILDNDESSSQNQESNDQFQIAEQWIYEDTTDSNIHIKKEKRCVTGNDDQEDEQHHLNLSFVNSSLRRLSQLPTANKTSFLQTANPNTLYQTQINSRNSINIESIINENESKIEVDNNLREIIEKIPTNKSRKKRKLIAANITATNFNQFSNHLLLPNILEVENNDLNTNAVSGVYSMTDRNGYFSQFKNSNENSQHELPNKRIKVQLNDQKIQASKRNGIESTIDTKFDDVSNRDFKNIRRQNRLNLLRKLQTQINTPASSMEQLQNSLGIKSSQRNQLTQSNHLSSLNQCAQQFKSIIIQDFQGNYIKSNQKLDRISQNPSNPQFSRPDLLKIDQKQSCIFIGELNQDQFKDKTITRKLYQDQNGSNSHRECKAPPKKIKQEKVSMRLSDILNISCQAQIELEEQSLDDDTQKHTKQNQSNQNEIGQMNDIISQIKTKNNIILQQTINQVSRIMGKIVHQQQVLKGVEYQPEVLYEACKDKDPLNQIQVNPLEARFIRIPLDIYENADEDADRRNQNKIFAPIPLNIYFVKDTHHLRCHMKDPNCHTLDLQIYASMSEQYPCEENHQFSFKSFGHKNIVHMTINPKTSVQTFSQKSLYVGLYSFKGIHHLSFIFGFGPNRNATIKRKLMQQLEYDHDEDDNGQANQCSISLSNFQARQDQLSEGQEESNQYQKIDFLTDSVASKKRIKKSRVQAQKEFKNNLTNYMQEILKSKHNDIKMIEYLENIRKIRQMNNSQSSHQKTNIKNTRSSTQQKALNGKFDPKMLNRDPQYAYLHRLTKSRQSNLKRRELSEHDRAVYIKQSISEQNYKIRFVQAFKIDFLRKIKEDLEQRKFKLYRQQRLLVKWMAIIIAGSTIAKSRYNLSYKNDLFFKTVQRIICGKRIVRILKNYVVRKYGQQITKRDQMRIQMVYKFQAKLMLKSMVVPNCKQILRTFLYDRNRIYQLKLKIRIFFLRMINIQKKFRAFSSDQLYMRRDIATCIRHYCGNLRDIILLNKFLYRKYQWIVDEMISFDLDEDNFDTPLNILIKDQVQEQSLKHQINLFRWHLLYGESQINNPNPNYVFSLIQRLQIIVDRHQVLLPNNKLKQYTQALSKIENYVRTKLNKQDFGLNLTEILPQPDYDEEELIESKRKRQFASLGLKVRMRIQQKQYSFFEVNDDEQETIMTRQQFDKMQKKIEKQLLDDKICNEVHLKGLMQAQKLDSLLIPKSNIRVTDENYDFQTILCKALLMTKIQNKKKQEKIKDDQNDSKQNHETN